MAYLCESVQLHNGIQTCVTWIQQKEPEFNLLDISVADANLLLSQVLVCFATVWVYNLINKSFKGN